MIEKVVTICTKNYMQADEILLCLSNRDQRVGCEPTKILEQLFLLLYYGFLQYVLKFCELVFTAQINVKLVHTSQLLVISRMCSNYSWAVKKVVMFLTLRTSTMKNLINPISPFFGYFESQLCYKKGGVVVIMYKFL